MMNNQSNGETAAPVKPRVRKAIGPRLRIVYNVVLFLLSLIAANSLYLSGVTFLEWWTKKVFKESFYIWMVLGHIVLGILIVVPFLIFGLIHMRNTASRKIRTTVRIGYALFAVCLIVLGTGFALVRLPGIVELKSPVVRSTVYWLHVAAPVAGIWLYSLHRLVGPKIRWRAGMVFGGIVGVTALLLIFLQSRNPRDWNAVGPAEGEAYFAPSPARTTTGNFIPAAKMDMNQYCLECHGDAHAGWKDSVHHFSSFNNPAYLASIAETREVLMERDGDVQGSRWCAGCHDPVPFFSGAFDNPDFDMLNDPTADSGITCTACHAITNINSMEGNGDYTIEEPVHYPFAQSDNALLKWVNHQLIRAKPGFHKKTFLKPFHETEEFCAVCHKVSLPYAVNHYRDWLRGQNHYDSYLLSGVSGHGARSFYYPQIAETNCNGCHMPLVASDDFGARVLDDSGELKIHDHMFPSANTAVARWKDREEVVRAHQEYLQGVVRVDLFGVREGGTIDGELVAPLRPQVPNLKPGQSYLLEAVIRTLKMGHHFTQGTTDSNQIWLEITARSGGSRLAVSGEQDETGRVDPASHFVNTFMLDRDGNRINRRNAQDIFVPLYSHQIPPGAGQTVHYRLDVPADCSEPIDVRVRLLYRKFDTEYLDYIDQQLAKLGEEFTVERTEDGRVRNTLPITVMAEDTVRFAVGDQENPPAQPESAIPEWQRWNDYGIGLLLKGKAELRQAADAFRRVESLNRPDGALNLARALFAEAGNGQLDEAVDAIRRAAEYDDPAAPPWTMLWLSGLINRQQGRLEQAEENFRQVLTFNNAETAERKFDFSQDYVVNNLLGLTVFDRALQIRGTDRAAEKTARLQEAVRIFERTLELDSENVDAHYNLAQLHAALKDTEKAGYHAVRHARYKPDDTARGRAFGLAKARYPEASAASEPVVVYALKRPRTSAQPAVTGAAEE